MVEVLLNKRRSCIRRIVVRQASHCAAHQTSLVNADVLKNLQACFCEPVLARIQEIKDVVDDRGSKDLWSQLCGLDDAYARIFGVFKVEALEVVEKREHCRGLPSAQAFASSPSARRGFLCRLALTLSLRGRARFGADPLFDKVGEIWKTYDLTLGAADTVSVVKV
jgi:hypothetical protein